MLVDFSVTNFLSFRDRTIFDMRPAKSKTLGHDDTNIGRPKLSTGKKFPLLLSSAIYGANAGGKTNFTVALRAMDRIVLSFDNSILEKAVIPFRLSKKTSNKPTIFEITIIASDGVLYEFGFSATSDKIHKEWLHGYPNGRMKLYYKRKLKKGKKDEYEYTNRLLGDKKSWERMTRSTRLFLSTAVNFNCKELEPVYDWFAKTLNYIGDELPIGFSANYYMQEKKDREHIIDFVKFADSAIKNIKVEEEDVPKDVLEVLTNIASMQGKPDDAGIIGKHQRIFMERETLEGDTVRFDFGMESQGTQKIFALSVPILLAIRRSEVLILDEFHNSLHTLLARYIIRLFHRKNSQAQLILATHDCSLLDDDDLLRRDQIWFCEEGDGGASELYSLVEFKIRNEVKIFERAYLAGRYGGIPIVPEKRKGRTAQWQEKQTL